MEKLPRVELSFQGKFQEQLAQTLRSNEYVCFRQAK